MTVAARAAEEHVLGAVLLEPERWQQVSDLTLTNFAYPEHRAVFATLAELAGNGGDLSLDAVLERLTATDRLKVAGGEAAVRRLRDDTATASTISHYAMFPLRSVIPWSSSINFCGGHRRDPMVAGVMCFSRVLLQGKLGAYGASECIYCN